MAFRHIEVEAATPTVGAYVSGVDLNQVSSKTIYAEIKLALWKHGVLFFRAQKLKPEAYLRLGQVFGDMEKHEFFPHLPDHPQIQLISHEGIDNPETDRWHTDVTFRKNPTSCRCCALLICQLRAETRCGLVPLRLLMR